MAPDLHCMACWDFLLGGYKFINKYSIGIEISNPGIQIITKIFKQATKSIIKLSKYLIRKYKIKHINVVGHQNCTRQKKRSW